eukprot:TRINITY_DN6806_c0_g1_i1.p1 TRINITY_DN6806_c0_g1~~TRINITY_DN6806_c0_g1_i1.p1  ORF type:complete len:141 (-),score=51.55 TRINITY_DN6806_c0_g1_i1:150-572(-)
MLFYLFLCRRFRHFLMFPSVTSESLYFFFLMIRRPPRSTQSRSSAASDVYKRQEVGMTYKGKVVRIMDFGAFVNFMGSRDGLVHISELVEDRVEKVTDVVNEGDEVYVKCLEIDGRGKVRLSMRVVNLSLIHISEPTRPY